MYEPEPSGPRHGGSVPRGNRYRCEAEGGVAPRAGDRAPHIPKVRTAHHIARLSAIAIRPRTYESRTPKAEVTTFAGVSPYLPRCRHAPVVGSN
jgi:hypothetical protein